MQNKHEALIEAFEKAGEAHAMAFIQVGGEDPDWAIWYAGFLQRPLSSILGRNLSKAEIVTCLISVEEERLGVTTRKWRICPAFKNVSGTQVGLTVDVVAFSALRAS